MITTTGVAADAMLGAWPHLLHSIVDSQPTVGALMDLCEENYRHLLRMVPEIGSMSGRHRSTRDGHADLFLEVIEQSRYTTQVHLTYYFDHNLRQEPDPDAFLRVYHDSRQLEVIELSQRVLPTESLYAAPGLLNKWRANLFVSKWLAFCVYQGHVFDGISSRQAADTAVIIY